MKYKTLYIDPPWKKESGGGKVKRGADRHYPLMSVKEMMEMPISHLVHPEGCHLYLWATNSTLFDALKVMKGWGFEYVTCITWFKPGRHGLGQYFRGCTEHVLFGTTKKRLPYKIIDGKRQQGITGFIAERQGHSVKPEEMRRMIERVSYPPFLEIFARREYPNWTCVGNEVNITIEDLLEGKGLCT